MEKLKWGIMATGFIASRFAEGLATSKSGSLHAVSSRNLESAQSFAKKHRAKKAFGEHDQLLADSEIDAVYIATPHPFHAELALNAAKAGKHILCEKPLAMSMEETVAIQEAARRAQVILMEAYMYRCHPQTTQIAKLIQDGELGEVRLVQATFGFHAPFDPDGRLFSKKLGGGAILDVGGYPASFACMVEDAAFPEGSGKLLNLSASGTIDPRCDTDVFALANLEFASGLKAQLAVSTLLQQDNSVRVYGEKAWLEIKEPWIVAPKGGRWNFLLHRPNKSSPIRHSGREARELYGVEADTFANLVFGKPIEAPIMNENDTLRVGEILEKWQRQLRP